MAIHAPYGSGISADTARGPSAALWGNCPDGLKPWNPIDPNIGCGFWDDFTDFVLPGTQTTAISCGRYEVFSVTAGKWTSTNALPTVHAPGGIVAGLCDSDGDAACIRTVATPFLLNGTANGKLWFEARIAMTGIATNNGQLFCGLLEGATSATSTIPLGNADVANTSSGLVGFNVLEDGLGVLNSCWADRTTAYTYVQTGVGTFAANTFKKVGMLYDPGDSVNALTFWVNGVKQTTVVAQSVITAWANLDVNGVGPALAFFADSAGTSNYIYIDWWGAAQVIL